MTATNSTEARVFIINRVINKNTINRIFRANNIQHCNVKNQVMIENNRLLLFFFS